MDYIMQLILAQQDAFVTGVSIIAIIIMYLITKKAVTPQQSALIKGLTEEAVKILKLIFVGVELDHNNFNKVNLKQPIDIKDMDKNEAKLKIATQAVKEMADNKTIKAIQKTGDILSYVDTAYKILKPFVNIKKK